MILRFQSRDGNFRLTLGSDALFTDLLPQILEKLPPKTDPASVCLSNRPEGGDQRKIQSLAGVQLKQVGLKHGDQLFIAYKEQESHSNGHSEPPTTTPIPRPSNASNVARIKRPWETVKQSALDDRMDKLDGKIARGRDYKMCKHGQKGMCDYCMPLEPYDANHLKEKKIKHMSFHSHLRKLNQGKNKPESGTSYMPPLNELFFRVRRDCPSGHAPFPAGICTKCQPSAISLQQQQFRMIDHVEFATFDVVDKFLNFWRRSGAQRIGMMYGHYEEYPDIPLGIKAVVEAIYEMPQINEVDGITLGEWENELEINKLAEKSNLEQVGIIFTDLVDAGDNSGKVLTKRHADSYFLSSLEVMFAARMQALRPKASKWSETGRYGSNFVTCVVTGNEEGLPEVAAYQASETAVEMVRADIIEPAADPTKVIVQTEEDDPALGRVRYIPEVFYRHINEYGANVQDNAKPAFPVDYLLVTLSSGFPAVTPTPQFRSIDFAIENREILGELQSVAAAAKQLGSTGSKLNETQLLVAISDFHLLCYLHSLGILSEDEERILATAARTHATADGFALFDTPGWATLMTVLQTSGEHSSRPSNPRKRVSDATLPDEGHRYKRNPFAGATENGDQLAKAVRGVSLN